MKSGKIVYFSITITIIGIILFILGTAEIIDNMWGAMGSSFAAIGIVQLVRQRKYATNEEYREKVDISTSDERNIYINTKAWAMASTMYIVFAAVTSVVSMVVGKNEITQILGITVFVFVIFFLISYACMKRKY